MQAVRYANKFSINRFRNSESVRWNLTLILITFGAPLGCGIFQFGKRLEYKHGKETF